jgi:hypothetical protein
MDPTWIQVFVLTLSECVAPVGKTVCQENEIEMQFLSETECQVALVQLITLKDQFENTIVNRQASGCAVSARQTDAFASLDDAKAASDADHWRDPEGDDGTPAEVPHSDRLENLKTCEESLGIAPCKLGDIIIEGTVDGRPVEVWRGVQ